MMILLLALVGLGVALSLFLLFLPTDNTVENQKYFQGVVVGELRQLKEQVFSLTRQVKNLGEKQAVISGNLPAKAEVSVDEYVEVDKVIKLNDENDGLRQQVSELLHSKEENRELARKVVVVNSEIIKLKDMYEQQEKLIRHLQENENNLRLELEAAKRRELRLAQNLNKQEELCGNLESELDSMRAPS